MFFSNNISNKWIIIDDKDPPWMSDEIKNNNYRNIFYQQLKKNKINLTDHDVVNELTSAIFNFFSKKG